jgi:hypothetical protein
MSATEEFKLVEDSDPESRRARKLFTMSRWRAQNPNRRREWQAENSDHVREYAKKYRAENKDYSIEKAKRWRRENPERVKHNKREWQKQNKERISSTPHLLLKQRLRVVIRTYLEKIGEKKRNRPSSSMVGCDPHFFVKWIASQFVPGMSFQNRSQWELDHIFPVTCCGNNVNEVIKAQHYRNFQPLWKLDNKLKGDKLTPDSVVAGFLCGLSEIHLRDRGQASDETLKVAERLGFKIFRNYK